MPPTRKLVSTEVVSPTVIREHFNSGGYWQRTQSGELPSFVMENRHPENPPAGEPFCTHSQIVYYYTKRRELVAIVHQYVRPDGTLGGSGKPDPKWLRLADRAIRVRAEPRSR
jgi:hypothetical protein